MTSRLILFLRFLQFIYLEIFLRDLLLGAREHSAVRSHFVMAFAAMYNVL